MHWQMNIDHRNIGEIAYRCSLNNKYSLNYRICNKEALGPREFIIMITCNTFLILILQLNKTTQYTLCSAVRVINGHQHGDYQYDTVPEECPCPVCLEVQVDPHQVTCCGKIFCKSCLDQLIGGRQNCPNCRSHLKASSSSL